MAFPPNCVKSKAAGKQWVEEANLGLPVPISARGEAMSNLTKEFSTQSKNVLKRRKERAVASRNLLGGHCSAADSSSVSRQKMRGSVGRRTRRRSDTCGA
jgi:hypothetical protein